MQPYFFARERAGSPCFGHVFSKWATNSKLFAFVVLFKAGSPQFFGA